MSKRSIKVMALVLLGALLATLPALAGCAKEKAEAREIVVGFLGDLTGPAAFAVKDVHYGLQDYLRMTEEEDPIPGVTIKLLTYDTKSDSSRVMPGYAWLKGKGADIVFVLAAGDIEILADRLKEDEIPALGSQASRRLLDDPWIYSMQPPPETQAEVIMQWIMDTWDYDKELGRLPKVGHLGCSGFHTTVAYQTGIDEVLAANPGKFDWAGVEKGPYMATAWAPEIARLKDCDFIIVSTVGPSAVSFVKEARARGYEKAFVSGIEAFAGFWELMQAAVDPEDLHDCFWAGVSVLWDEPVSWIVEAKEAVLKYRAPGEAEYILARPAYLSGWLPGMVLTDTIRRAVGEVGAENVDGPALRHALAGIDMTLEGLWNPWRFTENVHCLMKKQRMEEWSVAEEKWVLIGDIYCPPSLDID